MFTLYRKYFSGQLGQPQLTAALIKEADVEFFDPNLLYRNVVYLKDSGLVKGLDVLGQPYPYTLTITNLGIDYIDKLLKMSFILSFKISCGRHDKSLETI
jgi:hypothetical protein